MAYRGDTNRGGDHRWRDRSDRDYRSEYGRSEYGRSGGYRGDDDRGFFDRAGDEIKSWFGDDDAQRRREADERRWEREQGYAGRRDNYGYQGSRGQGSRDYGYRGNYETGGFGNQRGWGDDDRFASERDAPGGYGSTGGGADTWSANSRGYSTGAGGFGDSGSEDGRRFDRVDAGSTGTHAAHPQSAPVGGSSYRRYPTYGEDHEGYERSPGRSGSQHDPHYSAWRRSRIEELDRDYDDYRREHQSKFEQEFGSWRTRRQNQREQLGKVSEHMEVVGSDGQHVGTVDKVRGDRIILTKNDQDADGKHHSIPCSWIESVDDKVTVSKTAEEAKAAWRDEERNRALFEREDQGQGGPGILNRSFSGTY